MVVSYYNSNFEFLFTREQQNFITYNYTTVIYSGDFVKPKFDDVNDIWYENATQQDIDDYEESLPTLASIIALKYGKTDFNRDIDVQIDHCEFFKQNEKVYNMKGEPQYKDYSYIDENDNEYLVCKIIYNKIYEDLTSDGFTKNEFVGSKTTFRFYTKEDGTKYKEKIIRNLPFKLTKTLVTDENDVITDVVYSSIKREGILRQERYKADEVMKSFNPELYYIISGIPELEPHYIRYKDTGEKDALVNELLNPPESIAAKLQEEVMDEDKIAIGLPPSYPLTIIELIIGSLQ